MRKWKEDDEHEKENGERWLLTYSDMITLLLALFIMLYAMSNVDAAKFKALAESLSAVFNNGQNYQVSAEATPNNGGTQYLLTPGQSPDQNAYLTMPSASASPSATSNGQIPLDETTQQVADKLNALIQQNGIQASVSVHIEERGVVVSLKEGMLFPSGSADINTSAIDPMNKIAQIITSTKNFIRVEGSTDNVPISTSQFPSNWELASQRAINVAKLFISEGVDATRISVTSYGEYRPVAANDSDANRQQNRRVDIVFLNQNLNMSEAGGTATPAPSK
jgi:Flagellar motor protein